MCSVFLPFGSGWRNGIGWNLVPPCKIDFAIFPLRNWTSGGCGCGVFGYLSRPSLVLPGRWDSSLEQPPWLLKVRSETQRPSARRLGWKPGIRGLPPADPRLVAQGFRARLASTGYRAWIVDFCFPPTLPFGFFVFTDFVSTPGGRPSHAR